MRTNRIVKVLLKIITIKRSYGETWRMPTFGLTLFDHNSAVFWPIGLKKLTSAEETIIYRLVMLSPSCRAYFLDFDIWASFGGKWEWLPDEPLRIWSLTTQQFIQFLRQLLPRNSFLRPEPPSLPLKV